MVIHQITEFLCYVISSWSEFPHGLFLQEGGFCFSVVCHTFEGIPPQHSLWRHVAITHTPVSTLWPAAQLTFGYQIVNSWWGVIPDSNQCNNRLWHDIDGVLQKIKQQFEDFLNYKLWRWIINLSFHVSRLCYCDEIASIISDLWAKTILIGKLWTDISNQ